MNKEKVVNTSVYIDEEDLKFIKAYCDAWDTTYTSFVSETLMDRIDDIKKGMLRSEELIKKLKEND